MTPQHHPSDDLLMAHAAGTLGDAGDLLVATHLALCPTCRAAAARFEAVGGALIDAAPPVVHPDTDRALAAIFASTSAPLFERRPARPPGPDWMPEPLRSRVGPVADADWQRLVPGVIQQIPLESDAGTLRLVRMRPGAVVPDHGHQGDEMNLVLSGGFVDRGEHFDRGDLALADSNVVHDLRVDPGEACVILQLLDAPIVPRTMLGRVVGALTGES